MAPKRQRSNGRARPLPQTTVTGWHRTGDDRAAKAAARGAVEILISQRLQESDAPTALSAARDHQLAQTKEPISYREIGSFLEHPAAFFDGTIGGHRSAP